MPRKSAYWEMDKAWVTAHKEEIRAIQAVWNGTANEGQQIMALSYIVDDLCERSANQFYPTDRETNFALGKKFIGDHIAGAINTKLGKIQEPKS